MAKKILTDLEQQRARLFEAAGIVECVRHALTNNAAGVDPEACDNALRAAGRIVDDVAAALEQ